MIALRDLWASEKESPPDRARKLNTWSRSIRQAIEEIRTLLYGFELVFVENEDAVTNATTTKANLVETLIPSKGRWKLEWYVECHGDTVGSDPDLDLMVDSQEVAAITFDTTTTSVYQFAWHGMWEGDLQARTVCQLRFAYSGAAGTITARRSRLFATRVA